MRGLVEIALKSLSQRISIVGSIPAEPNLIRQLCRCVGAALQCEPQGRPPSHAQSLHLCWWGQYCGSSGVPSLSPQSPSPLTDLCRWGQHRSPGVQRASGLHELVLQLGPARLEVVKEALYARREMRRCEYVWIRVLPERGRLEVVQETLHTE